MHKLTKTLLTGVAIAMLISPALRASDDLALREEDAMKAAVDRVAPSVVRIETLGGLETVGRVLVGTGPTTGLIVSPDGYIISSAFNFIQKPSQILVVLPDGTRMPAELVSRDHSRMLVLLKIPADRLAAEMQLPVPAAVPVKEMRVGQWAIAIGRVFEGERPNVSVGILSALDRVWGKAIQTDAKISPSNYGGPLVDIQGRVQGVLVPMSPQESSEVAGVEWYDSGIGFAVPLEQIYASLDRLKEGDLHPGLLGVGLKKGDPYTTKPEIAACQPKSPAAEAGLKPGDVIVEIDGVKLKSQIDMRHQLAPRYAGETVSVAVLRKKDRIERSIELVDKLLPYVHPFLGVLPRRDTADGVVVRYVYPESPAAKAGIEADDRVISIDGKPVESRAGLQEQIAALAPMQVVAIEIERDGKKQKLEAKLATLPEAIPDSLPPARKVDENEAADDTKPATGKVAVKIPEAKNECFAYVPETYRTSVPHGLVVWLAPLDRGSNKDAELIEAWKTLCEAHDFILLVPKSSDPARWQRTDLEFLRRTVEDAIQKYSIDRSRVVVAGEGAGAAMAFLMTVNHRDLVRGVAAINAQIPPALRVPSTEPAQRLAILTTLVGKAKGDAAEGIKRFREAKHPVSTIEQLSPGSLSDEQRAKLARWADTLDQS